MSILHTSKRKRRKGESEGGKEEYERDDIFGGTRGKGEVKRSPLLMLMLLL